MSIYHGGVDVNCDIDIHLGFSRDGFYYTRTFETFIEQTTNEKYIVPTGGNILFVNDEIFFYYLSKNPKKQTVTNLAKLRRDGFISLCSENNEKGIIETKLLSVPYNEMYLFINTYNKNGYVSIKILDDKNNIIKKLSDPIKEDKTKIIVKWDGESNLYIDKQFRLKFYLNGDSEIFSFWMSKYETGESMGYIGNGGPKFNSYRDEKTKNKSYIFNRIQYICKDGDSEKMYIQKLNFKAVKIQKFENKICHIELENSSIQKIKLQNNVISCKLIL